MLALLAALAPAGCGGTDGNGGTAGTPACQDDPAGEAAAPPVRRPTHPILIAALGDSITAGLAAVGPRPARSACCPGPGPAQRPRAVYEYWAQAPPQPQQRVSATAACSASAPTRSRGGSSCTRGAQVLVVQGGINDIAQGRPARAARDGLRSMVRRGKARAWPARRRARGRAALEQRRVPRFTARDRESSTGSSPDSATRSPCPCSRSTTRSWTRAAGPEWAELTVDGDHPDVAGYRLLGNAFRLP